MSTETDSPSDDASRADAAPPASDTPRPKSVMLLGAVFVIANCGLIYELLAGTISSYLVGAAILQFSLVVGVFMAAMGLGAFLSRYVQDDLLDVFIQVELAVGFWGGLSAFILYLAFAHLAYYTAILYGLCALIGLFIGMEIPLVIRLLQDKLSLEVNVSAVLGLDYLGALVASILFPLVLLPYLGQMATAVVFGLLNVLVALGCCVVMRDFLTRPRLIIGQAALAGGILLAGLAYTGEFVTWFEGRMYRDNVIYSTTTKHQRVVLTKWRDDFRLYLNGNLQFSTFDEHRYHETLVHTVMGMPGQAKRVLVLGGGDGMAAREILKHDQVKRIDLVDLDGQLTDLFAAHDALRELNADALNDPRVHVINRDAQKFLEERDASPLYDRIIVDLPDPNGPSVGKLYTVEFYRLLFKHLAGSGYMITQASAPFMAREAFWCIHHTLDVVENRVHRGKTVATRPLHVYVPSFGQWGFVLASHQPIDPSTWHVDVPTRYLSEDNFEAHFVFPDDIGPVPTEPNHLDSQVLLRYYDRGWKAYVN